MFEKLKNCWKSRTVWVGSIAALLSAVQMIMPDLAPVLEPQTFTLVMFALSMTLVLLRFVTDKPLDEK